ncbi:hypothetical protein FAZ95_32330 [Trinickia violacea]|uniref:Uncharacterized protein n=1 Tax=Trinickia violacea TaxID=2571746 RepID=A0A4P8J180_9BURK|nr:hypothetical protein [Trinickia violacea]QCP53703.1 hypothetical protein FAZ95_32330 [Trinickia violacea]
MKQRYLLIGLLQLLLIFLSGWLRQMSWREIDFAGDTWPLRGQLSFYCLAGWLAIVATAIWFAVHDKANRSMIVLFLVLLLPSFEFLLWFALSF